MTKSTITREQLLEIIETDHVQCGEASYLARMALAAMDSEPVALKPELAKVIYHFRDWNEGFPVERFKADYVISWMLANYPPAQPAPVVPELMVDWQENEFSAGWNACRAAMIAAAPHDTPALNSLQSVDSVTGGWIPVSERIPDNTEPVLCIEKRADLGTYGQPFVCWHDGGGWVGKTNYRPIVTHWMPLPADPQEVK
ncbi:DUF551 domain-containing protein [Klebsiella pneumoniae]